MSHDSQSGLHCLHAGVHSCNDHNCIGKGHQSHGEKTFRQQVMVFILLHFTSLLFLSWNYCMRLSFILAVHGNEFSILVNQTLDVSLHEAFRSISGLVVSMAQLVRASIVVVHFTLYRCMCRAIIVIVDLFQSNPVHHSSGVKGHTCLA